MKKRKSRKRKSNRVNEIYIYIYKKLESYDQVEELHCENQPPWKLMIIEDKLQIYLCLQNLVPAFQQLTVKQRN